MIARATVHRFWWRLLIGALACLWGMAQPAEAQQPPDSVRARADSLAKARADSVAKARADSIARLDSVARTRRDPPADSAQLAQPDTLRPKTRADSLRVRADSIRAATMEGRELVDQRVEIAWGATDSVTTDLLQREGYAVTRYQGNKVQLRAIEHLMHLIGKRAVVQRDSSLIVGDTIVFNDSTQLMFAWGDTLVLRDPSQGGDDVVALGSIKYDIPARRGVVRNVTTAVESGQRWIVHGASAAFKGDTTSAGQSAFYAANGWLTSCEEKEPHYHFAAKEMKLISKNVMLVRPAVLYIGDVPVAWLPFVFNDMRPGRRSGLIAPNLGFNQVFRSSPFLRRSIENIGYFFAINDYVSSEFNFDWRSDARGTSRDPGWVRLKSMLDYRWKDRFIDGNIALSFNYLRNGDVNRTYSVRHAQKFSERTSFNTDFNYTSNTQVQQLTNFNPLSSQQTIRSSANFRSGRGPLTLDMGFTQTQYPGRDQLDRGFPTLSITSKPIEAGTWLTWTPSFRVQNTESFNLDGAGDFRYRYFTTSAGVRDSVQIKRDTRSSSVSFDTPIQIFGFTWNNAFELRDVINDAPERRTIYPNPRDTSVKEVRVFSRTYQTGLDWRTSFSLPTFSQGKFNIAPAVTIQKMDGSSPMFVRTERTGGKFVSQGLRPSFGVSMSPKFYGFFRGLGPVEAIRHLVEPQVQYAYTPRGNVSDEFLSANGDNVVGYLGNLSQNTVSFGLRTSFEAKLKPSASAALVNPADSAADTSAAGARRRATREAEGRKIRLLSLNFTTLTYDFVRARESSGGTGLTNGTFDWSAETELLPGFTFSSNYSLFQGDPRSDTAFFKPYREGIRTSLNLDANSPIIRGVGRLFGIQPAPPQTQRGPGAEGAAQAGAARRPSGRGDMMANRSIMRSGASSLQVPAGQGWKVSLSYTGNRQRPPRGDNVVEFDPRTFCAGWLNVDSFSYDRCLLEKSTEAQSTNGVVGNPTTRGGSYFISPPQANVSADMSFNITSLWSTRWNTSYDVTLKKFAQHAVVLQRAMHDWDAIFSFTKTAQGNFSFNFNIALRAQPDLKFDYDRATFPQGYTGRGRR